jgi:hypothetical protein
MKLHGGAIGASLERGDELFDIAGQINAASERLTAVKHHARLFADMVLTVSDAAASIRVDAAAMGEVMVYFTAQLEESIESLSMAHAMTLVLGEEAVEVAR